MTRASRDRSRAKGAQGQSVGEVKDKEGKEGERMRERERRESDHARRTLSIGSDGAASKCTPERTVSRSFLPNIFIGVLMRRQASTIPIARPLVDRLR